MTLLCLFFLAVGVTVDGGTIRVVHDADIRSAAIELLASSPSPSPSTHSLPLSLPNDPGTDTIKDGVSTHSSKGTNLRGNFISCPPDPSQSLGIKLPVLTLVLKSVHRFVSFEVQVVDDKGSQRRFRASNFQVGGDRGSAGGAFDPITCGMPVVQDFQIPGPVVQVRGLGQREEACPLPLTHRVTSDLRGS